MFPRQKKRKKKKKIWLDDPCSCSVLMSLVLLLSGATARHMLSAGGAGCSRQVSVPSPPLALFFLWAGMRIHPLCLSCSHLPYHAFPVAPPSVPPPPPRGPPHLFSVRSSFSECRLVEFRVQTPSSDESPGAAEGPLAQSLPPPPPPRHVPHLPLCNNTLKPTSVFNSMFIWTALGKWKLSLKTRVLKQQHEYKQLYLTNKRECTCI